MGLERFYGNDPVPPMVQRLLDCDERFGGIHEDFEVWNPEDWETEDPAHKWLGKDPSQRLVTIGHGGDGAIYLLWCHDGREPRQAPVCYLGSEGGGTILATNLEAFWEMLLGGEGWGPYDNVFYPPESEEIDEEEPEGPAYFRQEMRKDHPAPRAAAAIREEAIKAHPDFDAFVTAETS